MVKTIELVLRLSIFGDGPSLAIEVQPRYDTEPRYQEVVKINFYSGKLLNFQGTDISETKKYTEELTNAFFKDKELMRSISAHLDRAKENGLSLRLALEFANNVSEFNNIRWELLSLPNEFRDNELFPLSLRENIPFFRYSAPKNKFVFKRHDKLYALLAVANPNRKDIDKAWVPIDINEQFQSIKKMTDTLIVDRLPRDNNEQCSLNKLDERLQLGPDGDGYDILYLVCHGVFGSGETGYKDYSLLLENIDGYAKYVKIQEFQNILETLHKPPSLVVLSACESATQGTRDSFMALGPRLVRAGIPAVIAMQGSVTQGTLAKFMPKFFEELDRTGDVALSMVRARRNVKDKPDFWMPILYTNEITGILWKNSEQRTSSKSVEGALKPSKSSFVIIPPSFQKLGSRPFATKPIRSKWVKSRSSILLKSQIPNPPKLFIGREMELELIKRKVQIEGQNIVIITGPGGIGKSALAYKVNERLDDFYPDGKIYFDLQEAENTMQQGIVSVMIHIIRCFAPESELSEREEQVKATFDAILENKRVLILLENAKGNEQLAVMKNGLTRCLLIITSAKPFSYSDPRVFQISLPELKSANAVKLLQAIVQIDEGKAKKLAKACKGRPLSLRIIGNLLKQQPSIDFDDLIKRLEQ